MEIIYNIHILNYLSNLKKILICGIENIPSYLKYSIKIILFLYWKYSVLYILREQIKKNFYVYIIVQALKILIF